jgi:hypothetical protein
MTDRGLSCATNGSQGVLITFARPMRGIDAFGLIHPELTVAVEPDRLVALLTRRRSYGQGDLEYMSTSTEGGET